MSTVSRTLARLAGASVVALVIASLVIVPVAAKGPKGGSGTAGSGSITGVKMIVDQNGNGAPNWADTITFTFTSTNPKPYITLNCTTASGSGYTSTHLMYWPNVFNDPGYFSLQSPSWMSGGASCTALLYGTNSSGNGTLLNSYGFSVAA